LNNVLVKNYNQIIIFLKNTLIWSLLR